MRRFEAVAYAGLLLIVGIYVEETAHYYRNRSGQVNYPLFSSYCRAISGSADYVLCNVSGYGRTKYQRTTSSYTYFDPSSPPQSWQEASEREKAFIVMFGPEPQSEEAHPPVAH